MNLKYSLLFFVTLFLTSCDTRQGMFADNENEWNEITLQYDHVSVLKSDNLNGVIDLMGNGALMLKKIENKQLFQKTSAFHGKGQWVSDWQMLENRKIISINTEIITYGNEIDMRSGWVKFSGNPLLSGENTLLPLNAKNITDQTILLPAPGGVPQDQSILLGTGDREGKWLLFFNHTPDRWPYDYYWSFAEADRLAPIKNGVNPFRIDTTVYPLFGPMYGQAPNDWLEVNGVYYAPDETYDGESHMWQSQDIIHWEDMGPVTGILGADPGMVYDGEHFYLFNENGNYLTYNKLDKSFTSVTDGDTILHVGDHTGDPDLGFFNNRWHMFFDDGEHLHYNIGYAATSAEEFPYGWKLENDIYGPYNPDQGQTWDDDNENGNNFGTGDADFALEDHTLYMFTERPVGVAYRDLVEVYENTGQKVLLKIEIDEDGDYHADYATGWTELDHGKSQLKPGQKLKGINYRVIIELISSDIRTSPMVKYLDITVSR